ncbi:hypothetical protein [Carnimonas bestiolae]|uniref:hypothetical protein n=1 Tax=Carnimonas bestiolae TaxID=3402172 RepID=UPI003EDCA717
MTINVKASPRHQATPSQQTIQALNDIRERHSVVSVGYSDVFSLVVDSHQPEEEGNTLAQSALKQVGESYQADSSKRWQHGLSSSAVDDVPNWRYDANNGSDELRARFAKAYNVVHVCSLGIWGNAEYSDHTSMTGQGGGGDAFPIFPADMLYIANGPASQNETPELGFQYALRDLKTTLRDETILTDYLNAANYTLFSKGVIVDGKSVDGEYYIYRVRENLMSSEYQRYMRDIRENASEEINRAADYFFNQENATLSFLTQESATSVEINRRVSLLLSTFSDVYYGEDMYSVRPYFDTYIFPHILRRVGASVEDRNAKEALNTLVTVMSANSSNAAERNNQIENLLVYYASDVCIGKANDVIFSSAVIQQGIDVALDVGLLGMNVVEVKEKIQPAVDTLNQTGILGALGFLAHLCRAASDTLSLSDSIANHEVTEEQILILLSRYLGVYAGLGNFLNFINFIQIPAQQAFLNAARMLKFDKISPAIWGAGGIVTAGLPTANSAAVTSLEKMAEDVARNFSTLPFDQETDFINTFFNHEIESVAISGSRSTSQNIAYESVQQTAHEIEQLSENTISLESALSATKAFGISLSLAGFLADALVLAASVVALAKNPSPSTEQILGVSADALTMGASAIGVGIACGFLESAAFPPLALALTVGSVLLSLSSVIVNYVEARQVQLNIRQNMTNVFQKMEADGYLHEWGEKIQFLAIYYDTTRDKTSSDYAPTRWSPPDVAIFEDEAAAWNAFKNGTGDTRSRFFNAAHLLVHAKLTSH